ncbi:hypothetical protein LINPERHAP2_LOCUS24581 [Linum perenne]
MQQSQTIPRTYPSSSSKRHHFDLLYSLYIKRRRRLTHKPLRLKRHRILPHFRIPTHLSHHEIHRPLLRHHIFSQFRLLRHRVRQHEMRRRMSPESF